MTFYRAEDPYHEILNYEFNDPDERFTLYQRSLTGLLPGSQKTAADVVNQWTEFTSEPFSKMAGESRLPCWSGHNEQFGRVMFHLVDVVQRKEEYMASGRFKRPFFEILPSIKEVGWIAEGPDGTEDRLFYRCWFDLIGHPDFRQSSLLDIEGYGKMYYSYVLGYLALDLSTALLGLKPGQPRMLHLPFK